MADIEVRTLSDGKRYKVCNETCYAIGTEDKVIEILEKAREEKSRLRFLFCYPSEEAIPKDFAAEYSAEEVWLEEYGVLGRVGRSMGAIKIPLLISKSNSCVGGSLLTDYIGLIKDVKTRKTLYCLPHLHMPQLVNRKLGDGRVDLLYRTEKMTSYKVYATLKNKAQEERLDLFLCGFRNNKGGTI